MSFYNTNSEKRWWFGLTGRVWLLIVVVAVTIAGVSIAFTVGKTATSNFRGKQGATQQKNSTGNRVFQQQAFEQKYADFNGDIAKIREAGAVLTQDTAQHADATTLQQDRTDLVGISNHCISVAEDYNAQTQFYLAKDFLDAQLPASLDPTKCAS